MMKNIYILNQGCFRSSRSTPVAVLLTKKDAGKMCRTHGYKWDSYEQAFINEKTRTWIRVDVLAVNKFITGDIVSFGLNTVQQQRKKSGD